MTTPTEGLPVVVIGAGPAGSPPPPTSPSAASSLLVLEAGPTVAAAVREWAHVRLFSTWGELVDPAAEKRCWPPPAGSTPTRPRIPPVGTGPSSTCSRSPTYSATGSGSALRVVGVSRTGRDRIVDADRDQQPFVVHIAHADGREERVFARACHRRLRHLDHTVPCRRLRPARPRREGRRRPDRLPRARPQRPGRPRPLRGAPHCRHRLRGLRIHGPRLPRRPCDVRRRRGREGGLGPAPGYLRLHLRRWQRRPAPRPRSPRPRGEAAVDQAITRTRSPDSAPKRSNATPTAAWSWWAKTDAA